jgi:hypothetical protein
LRWLALSTVAKINVGAPDTNTSRVERLGNP